MSDNLQSASIDLPNVINLEEEYKDNASTKLSKSLLITPRPFSSKPSKTLTFSFAISFTEQKDSKWAVVTAVIIAM